MDLISIIILAFALSIDALSVSIINGLLISELKLRHSFGISFSFGLFQALMPVLGWAVGLKFRNFVTHYSHWVAFILLTLVAAKMIYESQFCSDGDEKACRSCLDPKILLSMSIATSIDALAIGVTFSILKMNIILPVLIIGFITFVVCLIGIITANYFRRKSEMKLELIGGVVLILIGLKILIEGLIA